MDYLQSSFSARQESNQQFVDWLRKKTSLCPCAGTEVVIVCLGLLSLIWGVWCLNWVQPNFHAITCCTAPPCMFVSVWGMPAHSQACFLTGILRRTGLEVCFSMWHWRERCSNKLHNTTADIVFKSSGKYQQMYWFNLIQA